MPHSALPLALLALANATAPDRALRAPTLEPAHDQSPRERAALATPERAAHTVLALTLLHTACSSTQQTPHGLAEHRTRLDALSADSRRAQLLGGEGPGEPASLMLIRLPIDQLCITDAEQTSGSSSQRYAREGARQRETRQPNDTHVQRPRETAGETPAETQTETIGEGVTPLLLTAAQRATEPETGGHPAEKETEKTEERLPTAALPQFANDWAAGGAATQTRVARYTIHVSVNTFTNTVNTRYTESPI